MATEHWTWADFKVRQPHRKRSYVVWCTFPGCTRQVSLGNHEERRCDDHARVICECPEPVSDSTDACIRCGFPIWGLIKARLDASSRRRSAS